MAVAIGVLRDHDGAGGERFARAFRLAIADTQASGRLADEVDMIEERADGLPRGSRASIEAAFRRLAERGVAAIIGPAITDNGLVVRDLADTAKLPCINWTGGEQTRSAWMFQYQVGSLEEEPAFLALALAAHDPRLVALAHDDSIVGARYAECFAAVARGRLLVGSSRMVANAPGHDLRRDVDALRASGANVLVYLGLWDAARGLALALVGSSWHPRVFANSALMYGHARPDWRAAWEGWHYVDAYADRNPVLLDVRARLGGEDTGPPVTVGAAYDMGRLLAEAIGAAPRPATRAGVRAGLETVKLLPAALGAPGTTMGFGRWERAALKGRYLVLRTWRAGASVEVAA